MRQYVLFQCPTRMISPLCNGGTHSVLHLSVRPIYLHQEYKPTMSTVLKIESADLLKMDTLTNLGKDIVKKLHVNLSDEDDDSLMEQDFVQWVVSIGGNKYNFYHGFPGDNPMGVLVDLDNTKVLAVVGEGGSDPIDEEDEDAVAFVAYYDEVTEEACNYEMKEFRAFEISKPDGDGNEAADDIGSVEGDDPENDKSDAVSDDEREDEQKAKKARK